VAYATLFSLMRHIKTAHQSGGPEPEFFLENSGSKNPLKPF